MQLNQLLAAPGFGAWLEGEALDIDRLLYGPNGRPRVSVISIAHLDDQERMFFVSLLLNEIVGWMRSQRGTSSLRALVYFDEIFGFLPPVANPPSKPPLLTLLETGARVWPGHRGGHAESRRPRLQGALQRRHVDAGPAANRTRQGARPGRPRRRRRDRGRGVRSGTDRSLALLARESGNSSCTTFTNKQPIALRDEVGAFVPTRSAGSRRNQTAHDVARPVPDVPGVPARSEAGSRVVTRSNQPQERLEPRNRANRSDC